MNRSEAISLYNKDKLLTNEPWKLWMEKSPNSEWIRCTEPVTFDRSDYSYVRVGWLH